MDDPFDPKNLQLPEEVVQASLAARAEKAKGRKPPQDKMKGDFVQVPLPWAYWALDALSSTSQTKALLRLLYRLWKKRKSPAKFAESVKLTAEDMDACGVSADVRNRMLRRLERAGLASVQSDGQEGPVVTLFLSREPATPEWDALEAAIEEVAAGASNKWRPRDLLAAIRPPDGFAGAWPKTEQQLTVTLRRHRPGSVRRQKGETYIFWSEATGKGHRKP